MSGGPVFSVVVPTYDRAAVLPRAISSVLAQTLSDFELIIVDDGSTDSTPGLLAGLDDPRVRCLRQENRGVSAARNLGLFQARGAAVTFLDSDDEVRPEWLAALAESFRDPQVGIVTCGAHVITKGTGEGQANEQVWLPRPVGPLYANRCLRYAPPGTLAARRELLQSVGGYAGPVEFAENAELAMRLVPACVERGLEVAVVGRPLVTYHRDITARRTGAEAFRKIRAGAEYILEHHGERMRSLFPAGYVNFRGIAGVNAARLGDFRSARRHLAEAVRAQPGRVKSHLRWALAWIPPLARLLWSRHG